LNCDSEHCGERGAKYHSQTTEQGIRVLQSNVQADESQHLQGGKKESNQFSKVRTTDIPWGDVASREGKEKKGEWYC